MFFNNLSKKDKENEGWYFPSGHDLEKVSASNAYIETFNDNKIESLAREVCQNSLDAADGSGKPVKIKFHLFSINSNDLPGYNDWLKKIIPSAETEWKNNAKTINLTKKMKKILHKSTISVLKISDSNTTGLEQENWKSLVEQAGSSVKLNEDSGGSFGIGKAAPFAVSDLRMVFYNTIDGKGTKRSIGVSKFVSYDIGNETTQGTGYFGKIAKIPFDHAPNFDINNRTCRGTDLYIMGFDKSNFPSYENNIVYSILDNFLIAICQNSLEVIIEDEIINKNNLSDYMDTISKNEKLSKKYNNLISYYHVLRDPNKKMVSMPAYPTYGIEKDEAVLILSNNTENNRRVLMTRKNGMKIFDKKRISSVIKFSGIFYATGKKINSVLKRMENPNHDKWSPDRSNNPREAKKFLTFITRFIKNSVIERYQEKIVDEVDAFGLNQFLPADLESLKRSNTKKRKKSNIPIVKLKPTEKRKSTKIIRKEEKADITDEELRKSGIISGDTVSFKNNTHENGKKNNLVLGNNYGIGDQPGNNRSDPKLNDMASLANIRRKKITDIEYRVLEINASFGKYTLLINTREDLKKVKIKVSIISDSGNKSKIKIISAETSREKLQVNSNSIYLDNLKSNNWQKIKFVVNQNNRLKLEVEVNENI